LIDRDMDSEFGSGHPPGSPTEPPVRDRLIAMIVTFAGGTAWIALSASSWGHAMLHVFGLQHGW
jgi:hypothetical protein